MVVGPLCPNWGNLDEYPKFCFDVFFLPDLPPVRHFADAPSAQAKTTASAKSAFSIFIPSDFELRHENGRSRVATVLL